MTSESEEQFGRVRNLSGYTVGDRGTVLSHLGRYGPREMSHHTGRGGYHRVDLRPDSGPEHQTYIVARLVLEAHFGPPPTPAAEASYRDGDRNNLCVDNLYWHDASAGFEARRAVRRELLEAGCAQLSAQHD